MAFNRRRRRAYGQQPFARPASELIDDLLGRHGAKRDLREHKLLTHWQEVVGPRVATRSTPDGLSRGVLWVRIANSAWMHEMSFMKDEIAQRANKICGDPPPVKEVRFHVGPRARPDAEDPLAPTVRIRRPAVEERPLPPPASGERLAEIERETSRVADDELRALITEARRRLNL